MPSINDLVCLSTISFGRHIARDAIPVDDTWRSFFPVKTTALPGSGPKYALHIQTLRASPGMYSWRTKLNAPYVASCSTTCVNSLRELMIIFDGAWRR